MGRDNFVAPTAPVDILADVLGGPKATQDMDIRRELAWDYGQLGSDANTAIEHTVAIKKSERRASEAIIEAGQHLIAMKGMLNHGQWGDWLATEFSMTDRTAQRMMQVAGKFNGKSDKLSDLKPSILYMLAADNVPDTAREQVIQEAQQTRPTIRRVREVIEQHSPHPVTPAKTVYTPVTIAGNSEPTPGTPIPQRVWTGITCHTWDGYADWNSDDEAEYAALNGKWQNMGAPEFNYLKELDRITRWRVAARLATQIFDNRSGSLQEVARVLRNKERSARAVLNTPAAEATPVVTLDELEVIDSVTVPVVSVDPDEEITHPLDCYDDEDVNPFVGKMGKLHELKMWLKATRDEKTREYRKLTNREIPALFTGSLDHMIAVLEETMDAVEQEAVAA